MTQPINIRKQILPLLPDCEFFAHDYRVYVGKELFRKKKPSQLFKMGFLERRKIGSGTFLYRKKTVKIQNI